MELEELKTPLDPRSLPELMEISDQQALMYVTQLLKRLIQRHEASIKVNERHRRPSYESSLEKAGSALRNLVASNTFSDQQVCDYRKRPPQAESPAVIEESNESEIIQELYKKFWLKEVPPISIKDYLKRFHRYCQSSAATYLTAGSLVYKISVELGLIPVTQRNVYRLFCAAFIISAKLVEDRLYSISRYATTAGLKKPELARLELSFLLLINFNVNADCETLKSSLQSWADLNEDATG